MLGLEHFFASLFKRYNTNQNIEKPTYFNTQAGIGTSMYPHTTPKIPEVGRYQLHVEIDDCIVCDLCAKACPVDCIEIEAVKAVGEIGKTSDGTKKRLYAANFEIDMAKCMFCGLCTIPCPTECIIMTDESQVAHKDVREFNYAFSTMTEQEVEEKKLEYEQWVEEKKRAKEKKMKQ